MGADPRGEVYRAGKGSGAFLHQVGAPPTWGMNWDEDIGAGEYPNACFFYLPRLCNHCSRPACVEACPNGALYKRAEDGVVLRDEERCKGEQACSRACPYKKIYFNTARRVSQHCIGGYGHLHYWALQWQPTPVDRAVRVDLERAR